MRRSRCSRTTRPWTTVARMLKCTKPSLKRIVDRFSDDTEAQIFHAIFRVANAPPTDLTFAQQKEAAQLLTRVVPPAAAASGPRALHHSRVRFAAARNLALDAARQYAGIAPAAPHALHMPSHIFTRLGYWDESIATNRRSADLEPTPGGKSHPLDYMVYAYLQQGRDEAALRGAQGDRRRHDGRVHRRGARARTTRWRCRRDYALERDDWKTAAALTVPPTPCSPGSRCGDALREGPGGRPRRDDVATAKQEVAALEKLVVRDLTRRTGPVLADCGGCAAPGRVGVGRARGRAARRRAPPRRRSRGQGGAGREAPGDPRSAHSRARAARRHPDGAQPAGAGAWRLRGDAEREPNRARTLVGACARPRPPSSLPWP